jgi:hypothetical protein
MLDNFVVTTDDFGIPNPLIQGMDLLNPKGKFFAEHWRDGVLLERQEFPNGVTNIGKDTILNTMFNSATQIAQASWCIGIINNASFTALAATDTMASHTGWIEFSGYSEANRVAWGPGSSSGQTVTNASAATFDITTTATLQGVFVTSNNTIGGTTGTLWTTALFSSPIPVTSGDQIKITYSIAC